LPDEDRSDDVIVQINNLRITRILLDPGIQNVKAIFFVARDIGWKCMLLNQKKVKVFTLRFRCQKKSFTKRISYSNFK
jgi:hypothetical protein